MPFSPSHGLRAVLLAVLFVALPACQTGRRDAQPAAQAQVPKQPLFLCCNLRTETDWFSDANYLIGRLYPAGTPIRVDSASRGVAYFEMDGRKFRLGHEYGTGQESFEQFMNKYFVAQSPAARIASYPPQAQAAVKAGKIARGMSKEQVIAALGYPPTHRTASLDQQDWTYWYNRWVTYVVQFDAQGRVRDVNANQGIKDAVLSQ